MKTIEIIIGTASTKDGKKFTTYKAVKADGKLMDCRFTKAVGPIPESFGSIVVDESACNVDRNRKYPVLWVKEVKEFVPRANTGANTEIDELF